MSKPSQNYIGSLLDPAFKYTPAAATDIRRTFERVRKQLVAEEKARQKQNEPLQLVPPLRKRRA